MSARGEADAHDTGKPVFARSVPMRRSGRHGDDARQRRQQMPSTAAMIGCGQSAHRLGQFAGHAREGRLRPAVYRLRALRPDGRPDESRGRRRRAQSAAFAGKDVAFTSGGEFRGAEQPARSSP